jgi:hypothetical protein
LEPRETSKETGIPRDPAASGCTMSLPEALERAAVELPDQADLIRPANGDPIQLLSTLDESGCESVLGWLLVNEPDAGEELMLDWCEDDRGIERVQSIDLGSLPKSGKKLLRKALHRMRTSGIDVATKSAPAASSSKTLTDVSDEIAGAYLTSVDPRGSVLLFIVEANPSGGARLFQAALDELRGIVEFDVYATGRSKTRKFLRKLTDPSATGASGAVQVDPAFARSLIVRIAGIHPTSRPFPRAFSEWRRKLESGASDRSFADQVGAVVTGTDVAASEAIERVAARIRAREIGPWPPTAGQLTAVSKSLGTAIDAVIEMSGDARDTALNEAVGAATVLLFEGGHPGHTGARFELSAYVAHVDGKNEEAADLLAAAQSMGGDDIGQNPIARAMTEAFTESVLKRVDDASASSDTSSAALSAATSAPTPGTGT